MHYDPFEFPAKALIMHNDYVGSDEFVQSSGAALLLVDIINDLEFPGGEELLHHARPMAERTAALKERATRTGIPTVYVNEPADAQKATFGNLVDHCLKPSVRGRPVVELLRPEKDDYFIVAPLQSAALLAKLDTLAQTLQFQTLILTGLAASIQVRFAANDAYFSGFRFVVPEDCVASKTDSHTRSVLAQVQTRLDADVVRSTDLPLQALVYAPMSTISGNSR
jgi:nicotinamidase-related amidase